MKKSILTLAMLVGLTVPVLAACGGDTPVPSEKPQESSSQDNTTVVDQSFTIKDVKGRQISFDKPAETALCVGAGALRLYSYVADMNKLVAVEAYEKVEEGSKILRPYQYVYRDIINAKPVCGKGGPGQPDYAVEQILTLKPDVVFTCDKADAAFLDDMAKQLNTPVVGIDYGRLNVFDTNVEGNPFKISLQSIAKIMGSEQRYTDLSAYMDEKVLNLDNKTKDIPDADKLDTYIGGVGKKKAVGLDCSDPNDPMLQAIHGKNIVSEHMANINGQLVVSDEVLITLRPDVVLIDYAGYADVVAQLADPVKSQTFANWDALKNGNSHVLLPYRDYNTQPEIGLLNALYAGSVLYPEVFETLDVAATGSEVFTKFYGVDAFAGFCEQAGVNDVVFKSVTF